MKNLKTLSNQEVRTINGGCQMDPCPQPFPFPQPYPNPNPDGDGPIIFLPPNMPTRPSF